jgi:hypothetical protein
LFSTEDDEEGEKVKCYRDNFDFFVSFRSLSGKWRGEKGSAAASVFEKVTEGEKGGKKGF